MKRGAKTATVIFILTFLITGLISPTLWFSLTGQDVGTANAQSQNESSQASLPFVPGRILVQFRPETTKSRSRRVIAELGASDAGELAETGVHIVELPAGTGEAAFAHAFKSRPEVEFAELDRIVPPAEMVPTIPGTQVGNGIFLRSLLPPHGQLRQAAVALSLRYLTLA